MSAARETIEAKALRQTASKPILNSVLDFLSSVRFGVSLLIILVVLSIIGMVVIQENVQGFDTYFASLTPAEKLVYGSLGLFDIYHSWYYNFLLLILSLNIVLASIDHFPTAWKYIVRPKLTATKEWLLNQHVSATGSLVAHDALEAAATVKELFESERLKATTTESVVSEYGSDAEGNKDFSVVNEKKQIVVFGEAGKYNRLGAYIVH